MDKTYYIFRHGDTYATKTKTAYNETIFTAEIIPESYDAIKRIGSVLSKESIDYFASSEIIRCRQTADMVSAITNIPYDVDKRLSEYDPDSPYVAESTEQFVQRIVSFVEEMKQNTYQHIAICAHGSSSAAITNLLLYNSFTEEDFLEYPAPGVLWIVHNKKIKEIDCRI